MHGIGTDVVFGVRTHLKAPASTAAVVFTLAFGIAANSLAFWLVNSVFIRALPVHQPERLVRIYRSYLDGPQHFTVSYGDYAGMHALSDVFSGVLVEEPVPISLGESGAYERIWGERVSAGYFSVLGLTAAHGRLFASGDHRVTGGSPPVVVLSYGLWRRAFGARRNVIGETLTLNGQPSTIIGVAPEGFSGTTLGLIPGVWLPLVPPLDAGTRRGPPGFFATARLRSGVDIEEARAALDLLARRLDRTYAPAEPGVRFTALPESQGRIHPTVRGGLLGFSAVMIAVAALLLVLACANAAGVLLARSIARRKEVGVRLALGASRWRIVRQFLIESAQLSLVAGGIGVALAWALANVVGSIPLPTARGAPIAFDLPVDGRVLGFSFLVTVLTSVLFGLTPALDASRSDVVAVLEQGRGRGGVPASRLRGPLVAVQVGLSLALLVVGGLFLRSVQHARAVDVGFDTEGVVVTSVDLAPLGDEVADSARFWKRVVDTVSAIPRSQSAGLADRVPFELNITTMAIAPEGYRPAEEQAWPSINYAVVDPGYFPTLRLPLAEGRTFTDRDTLASFRVVMVNEAFARRFWLGTGATGKRLRARDGETFEVIGVARQAKYLTLGEDPRPFVFLPLAQTTARTMTVLARGSGDARTFLREVREAVRGVDHRVPIYNVTTMREHVDRARLPYTFGAAVLNLVGLVALLLTSIGLYGTVACAVGGLTHEIGVRRALGARDAHVLWVVVRDAVRLVILGLACGGAVALFGSRLLHSVLYGIDGADPLVFVVAPIVVVVVCSLAAWLPARRAVRIDAADALRQG
jgi:predicted permease